MLNTAERAEVHVRTVFAPADYTHGDAGARPMGPLVAGYDAVVSHHGDTTPASGQLCIKRDIPHVLMVHGTPDQVDDSEGWSWNSESSRAGCNGIVVRPHVDPAIYRPPPATTSRSSTSAEKGGDLFRQIVHNHAGTSSSACAAATATPTHTGRPDVEMVDSHRRGSRRLAGYISYRRSPDDGVRTGVHSMCSGIPVIAHPTPGLVEVARRRRHLRRPDDLAGWVGAIRRLDDPDEYARRSAAALARAAELDTATDLDRFADYVEACA